MERITPPLVRNYPPVTLYLDHLEEIEEILKGAGRQEFSSETEKLFKGITLTFSSAEYKSENLADLTEKYKDQRLRSFHISVLNPGVQIYLERSMTRLYCVCSDTQSSGVFHRLDNIFKRAARKPRVLYSFALVIILMISVSTILNTLNIIEITSGSRQYFTESEVVFVSYVLSAVVLILLIWSVSLSG
jgi:hypothetical protein